MGDPRCRMWDAGFGTNTAVSEIISASLLRSGGAGEPPRAAPRRAVLGDSDFQGRGSRRAGHAQIRREGSQAGRVRIPRVLEARGKPPGLLLDSQSTCTAHPPVGTPIPRPAGERPGGQEADRRLRAQPPAGLAGPTPETVPGNLTAGGGRGGQSPEMGPSL